MGNPTGKPGMVSIRIRNGSRSCNLLNKVKPENQQSVCEQAVFRHLGTHVHIQYVCNNNQ